MIRVRWRCENRLWRLALQGHAGTAPKGQDLVCAAVSGLVYGLGAYVRRLEDRGLLAAAPVVELAPGRALICAEASGASALEGAFGTVIAGLELLARRYPDSVQLGGGDGNGGWSLSAGCDPEAAGAGQSHR